MFPFISLNAGAFGGRAKIDAFQDAVSAICKLEFRPTDIDRFESRTSIAVTPSLITGNGHHSPCHVERTSLLAVQTGDNVMIHIPATGGFAMRQRGGEWIDCRHGVVYIDPNDVPGQAEFYAPTSDVFYVSIPRPVFASVNGALGGAMRRGLPLTPQWRMFLSYARALHGEAQTLAPHELTQCAAHVQDLALMAFGASGESAEIARGRGVKAARLRMVKEDIGANLASPSLSAGWIAARHGISERYLRALFAAGETSFSDYVASRRLLLAHRLLTDPASAHQSISQIALQCGFGDLSWFNALFRRRYDATPSEVRARALGF